jgi:PTS system nitrogen regulatory IIA component
MGTAEPQIMTLEEVAAYLRVSERTVYDWANKGEIPCGKIGTTWRFKRSDIEQWVDQKLTPVPRAPHPGSVLLGDILTPERVLVLDCATKDEVLRALLGVLATAPQVKNPEELAREMFEREELMSTGIGRGIGVPHVRLRSVSTLVMAVAVNRRDLEDYTSLDERPVRVVCMVAARHDQHAQYLKTLATISTLLKDDVRRAALLSADSPLVVHALLTQTG